MAVESGAKIKAVMEMVMADGSIVQNVYHYRLAGGGTLTEEEVVDEITDQLELMYAAVSVYIDQNITVNPTVVYEIEWNTEDKKWETLRVLGEKLLQWTPDGLEDPLPNQCAATVSAATERPKSRGRKFLPGWGDQSVTGGDLNAGSMGALAAYAALYVQTLIVDVAQSLIPGIPRSAAFAFLDFTAAAINSVIGTQRQRKPGVGA